MEVWSSGLCLVKTVYRQMRNHFRLLRLSSIDLVTIIGIPVSFLPDAVYRDSPSYHLVAFNIIKVLYSDSAPGK